MHNMRTKLWLYLPGPLRLPFIKIDQVVRGSTPHQLLVNIFGLTVGVESHSSTICSFFPPKSLHARVCKRVLYLDKTPSGGCGYLYYEQGCHQGTIVHLGCKRESRPTCSQFTTHSSRKYTTLSDRGFGRISIPCISVSKSSSPGFAFTR